LPGADGGERLEPWASRGQPQDVAKRHVQEIGAAREQYRVTQGGTMDGTNCRSPVGGGFAIWDQTWESNRAVRLENAGETDVLTRGSPTATTTSAASRRSSPAPCVPA